MVLMLKCREDARIDHPGDEALHVKAQTTPGKDSRVCLSCSDLDLS